MRGPHFRDVKNKVKKILTYKLELADYKCNIHARDKWFLISSCNSDTKYAKVKAFLVIVDRLLQHITPAEMQAAVEGLIKEYPEDLENDLSAELTQFVKFLETSSAWNLQTVKVVSPV